MKIRLNWVLPIILIIVLALIGFSCEDKKEEQSNQLSINNDATSNHLANFKLADGSECDIWTQPDNLGNPLYVSDIRIQLKGGETTHFQQDILGRPTYFLDPSGYSMRIHFYLEGNKADVTFTDKNGYSQRGIIDVSFLNFSLPRQGTVQGLSKTTLQPLILATDFINSDPCDIMYATLTGGRLVNSLTGLFTTIGCIGVIAFDIATFPDIVTSLVGCAASSVAASSLAWVVMEALEKMSEMALDCDFETIDLGDNDPPVAPPTTGDVTLGGGDVHVTLTWDNATDVDLHVIEPNGEEIYFNHPYSASGGELDVDDIDGYGPENIFWEWGTAPHGQYTVAVRYWNSYSKGASHYNVTVRYGSIINDYNGTVNDDMEVDIITSFNY